MRWKLRVDCRLLTLVCALAALSGGCKLREPRTQVTLIVDADARVRELATELQVIIEGRNSLDIADTAPVSYAFELKQQGSPDWPYSIALVPRSFGEQRAYGVTATLWMVSARSRWCALRAAS